MDVTPPHKKKPLLPDNFFKGPAGRTSLEITERARLQQLCNNAKSQNKIPRMKLFLFHELYCQETPIRGCCFSKTNEKTYAIKGFE
ncbi:hypothetical protein [Pseudomonas cichorii]|uniref:hypothetical protein n=1 Tax=Pseudomonas cichorii TaxID=36746 RepID=UPI0019101301|nr:hypothetical protein [Pseudomonas cichorii]